MESSALTFRRAALAAAPLVAAVLIVAGVFLDSDIVTGFLGHLLCLPVALFAAWRGGLMHVWVPVTVSVATILAQVLQPFGSGLLVLAVAMVALAYALWRMPRPWERTIAAGA